MLYVCVCDVYKTNDKYDNVHQPQKNNFQIKYFLILGKTA